MRPIPLHAVPEGWIQEVVEGFIPVAYTTQEAPGAPIANGTRIQKATFERGDGHPVGARGTVIGSVVADGEYAYFVRWDTRPAIPVLARAYKIERLP